MATIGTDDPDKVRATLEQWGKEGRNKGATGTVLLDENGATLMNGKPQYIDIGFYNYDKDTIEFTQRANSTSTFFFRSAESPDGTNPIPPHIFLLTGNSTWSRGYKRPRVIRSMPGVISKWGPTTLHASLHSSLPSFSLRPLWLGRRVQGP